MTTSTAVPAAAPTFTPSEWHALQTLRACYQQDRDLFSALERMRLGFLRWLYQTGRLVPQHEVVEAAAAASRRTRRFRTIQWYYTNTSPRQAEMRHAAARGRLARLARHTCGSGCGRSRGFCMVGAVPAAQTGRQIAAVCRSR